MTSISATTLSFSLIISIINMKWVCSYPQTAGRLSSSRWCLPHWWTGPGQSPGKTRGYRSTRRRWHTVRRTHLYAHKRKHRTLIPLHQYQSTVWKHKSSKRNLSQNQIICTLNAFVRMNYEATLIMQGDLFRIWGSILRSLMVPNEGTCLFYWHDCA